MAVTKPRVRIAGRGKRLRVRTKGDWTGHTEGALLESCRASVAIEKAVAQAIGDARARGMSWAEIGRTLGVAEQADDKSAMIDAYADSRRLILTHQLRGTT